MNILICGAGEVGRHSAEVLADSGHSITIIDQSSARLAEIDEAMDVRSMLGDCAQAEVLIKAGVDKADLLIAATNNDEVNLLAASVANPAPRSSVATVAMANGDPGSADMLESLGMPLPLDGEKAVDCLAATGFTFR